MRRGTFESLHYTSVRGNTGRVGRPWNQVSALQLPCSCAFLQTCPKPTPCKRPAPPISKANVPLLRPFECSICSLPFLFIDEALFHMLRMHCTAVHECPYCPVTSKDFSGLRIHVDLAHKGEKSAEKRGNEDCLWCRGRTSHTKYCLVTKYNSGREGNRP